MLKLIPPFIETKPGVLDVIDRSGATFVEADKLHKLWPHIHTGAIVIAAIPTAELAVLQRFMASLLPEPPSVVTAVPGCHYSSEWNMLAAHLPAEPFSALEAQLLKSGFLSHTTEQAEARGAQVIGAPTLSGRNFRTPVAAKTEEDDEEDDALISAAGGQ